MGTDEAAPVSAAESLRLIGSQRDAKPAPGYATLTTQTRQPTVYLPT